MEGSKAAPTRPEAVTRVALVGLGTVGTGWAAAYLARGFDVVASDPAADAKASAARFLAAAWPALRRLGLAANETPPQHKLRFVATAEAAVAGADLVHENVPERLALKRAVLAQIEAGARPDAVIASSTGGIPATELAAEMRSPQRFVVMHPFNPPHLVPLVEVVGGANTDPDVVAWAMTFLRRLGKHPIRIDKEAPAFLTNRLQFALLREAIHCLVEGIASPQSIEDAVRYGLAPRWTAIGGLTTLTLAGGEGGMARILEHVAGEIDGWWRSLGAPTMTAAVKDKLVAAAVDLTKGKSLAEWAAWRDERLVDILRSAGAVEAPTIGVEH